MYGKNKGQHVSKALDEHVEGPKKEISWQNVFWGPV